MKSGLTDTPRWQWKPNDRPSREPRRLIMPYCSGSVATVSSGPVSYKMPVPTTHSRYTSSSTSSYRTSSSLSSSLERPFSYSSLSRTVPRSTSYTSEYKSKYTSPSRAFSSSFARQGSLSDDSSSRSSIVSRERSVETRERKNSTTTTTTTTTTTLGRRYGTSSSTLAGISVTEMFNKYSPSSYSPSSYSPVRYSSSRTAPGGCSITKVNNNEQDDDNGNQSVTEIRRRFDGASVQNGARSSPPPVVARKVYNETETFSSSEEEDEEEEEEEVEEMTSRRSNSPAGGVAGGAGSAVRRYSPAKLQPVEPENRVTLSPSPRLSSRPRSTLGTAAERGGLAGLRNIGNTCFMNSVIQCLSNTKPLLEYLLADIFLSDINTTVSSMKGALIKAFTTVIKELWRPESEGQVVNTTALKSQIQCFAPRFMGYSQQDAQEFLRYLLEGLHEDVNIVTSKPKPIITDVDDSLSDQQKAAESWRRYLRMDDSKIVDIFVGQLKSTLQCTSCGHCSVTFDPFWDLSLPIPARTGQVRLQQCFDHFTREEVLDGDEKPTCSKCQVRRKCTKSFTIQKFPKILVLHLKRFSPTERFRGKLNVTVDFPLTGLDLSAYAANRGKGCIYNLYGVANHSGTTYSGHYTAYCKHPYTGDWHEYNDSRVSTISTRSVVSSEAYVLFFELSGHSSHL